MYLVSKPVNNFLFFFFISRMCTIKITKFQSNESFLWRTGHDQCSHHVGASGHRSLDEGCETSTVPHFSLYSREVVQQVHDCVDVTCRDKGGRRVRKCCHFIASSANLLCSSLVCRCDSPAWDAIISAVLPSLSCWFMSMNGQLWSPYTISMKPLQQATIRPFCEWWPIIRINNTRSYSQLLLQHQSICGCILYETVNIKNNSATNYINKNF